jgi:hypothetical protein
MYDERWGYYESSIELDDGMMGKFTGNPLYLMVKTMVSCRFSLNPIQWGIMKVEVTFVIQKWN